jgi:regulator of protease activity HflC (stomatin/prohibitin superfamily)
MHRINRKPQAALIATIVLQLALAGCAGKQAAKEETEITPQQVRAAAREQVFQTTLNQIRLGDGVPIDLQVSVRWRTNNPRQLLERFGSVEAYAEKILMPRSRELTAKVSNKFPHVHEVFTVSRDELTEHLKSVLLEGLVDTGTEIIINGVVIPDIIFPKDFTDSMEQAAKNEQHLELLEQQKILDLEKAKAAREKARADGEVEIAKAEARGRVEEINAKTEEKSRLTTLAKAETEAQVIERKAKAEAEKQKLMAAAEAEKQRMMDAAEAEKQQKLAALEAEKQRRLDEIEHERRRQANRAEVEKAAELLRVELQERQELAAIFAENPSYASFLVSQELASKIQIAVLPVGTDNNVLSSLLQNSLIPTATQTGRKSR